MNPFSQIYARCNTGDPADKWANLADFPRMIDLELTSLCNFRCLMCPTGNRSLTRPAEFMAAETFETIVEQCRPHGTALRFIGWGEPTLHPKLLDFIHAASEAVLLTHLNTNGSKMTAGMANSLVTAGLSSIKFSFQGVDRKSYREMRNIDFFDGMLRAIEMMADARLNHLHRPCWIAASTTVTGESRKAIRDFARRVRPLVDELGIGKTIFGFMDIGAVRLKSSDRKRLERFAAREDPDELWHPDPCPEVYDKLSIHADGSVVLCCNDFNGTAELGNVNETPIMELWRSPVIEAYRERLARKDYDAPLCRDCWNYMGCASKREEAA